MVKYLLQPIFKNKKPTVRLADKSTVCLTILLSINNEEYVGQSIRGAYHTTASEKVSKLTALFLIFLSFFYAFRVVQFLNYNHRSYFCFLVL